MGLRRRSGLRWRRHLRWWKRKRREDRNRALQEVPESAHSGTQVGPLGLPDGGGHVEACAGHHGPLLPPGAVLAGSWRKTSRCSRRTRRLVATCCLAGLLWGMGWRRVRRLKRKVLLPRAVNPTACRKSPHRQPAEAVEGGSYRHTQTAPNGPTMEQPGWETGNPRNPTCRPAALATYAANGSATSTASTVSTASVTGTCIPRMIMTEAAFAASDSDFVDRWE